jgi:hypothetical protein
VDEINKVTAAALAFLIVLAACAGPTVSAPASAGRAISTGQQATVAAERLTTIAGPWQPGDVEHGTYEMLWRGSTSDLSGEGTMARASMAVAIVWRVALSGPTGREELYIDEATGHLLGAITQGN